MKTIFYIFILISLNLFSQTACIQYDSNFSGFCSEFHSNGKTKWIKEFQDGQAVGIWMDFDEKGNLVKQLNTSLKKDSLVKIYSIKNDADSLKLIFTSKDASKVIDVTYFYEPEPTFPGGIDSLMSFMLKHFQYPQRALDLGIEGRVYVKFIVEKDGSLSNIYIVRGLLGCPECDDEVLRIMHLMPNWIPAKNKGEVVRSHGSLPFNFTLK